MGSFISFAISLRQLAMPCVAEYTVSLLPSPHGGAHARLELRIIMMDRLILVLDHHVRCAQTFFRIAAPVHIRFQLAFVVGGKNSPSAKFAERRLQRFFGIQHKRQRFIFHFD